MSSVPSTARASRTRRDIIDAAISVWSAANPASLGEVADAAGVGRTTVNRYFSDRTSLVAAVNDECRERFGRAVERARPGEGSGLEALQRVCTEIIELGAVLGLIFADNALVDPDTWTENEDEDPIGLLVMRGLTDGSIASDLPAEWVAISVWTSLFAAWLLISTAAGTRHEASQLLVRTLASGIAPG